ncbi:hypothetical protein KM043_009918 [Ampulex compressa]|nr:hypothetical protein KM043_009918 [Ampulex compressa]
MAKIFHGGRPIRPGAAPRNIRLVPGGNLRGERASALHRIVRREIVMDRHSALSIRLTIEIEYTFRNPPGGAARTLDIAANAETPISTDFTSRRCDTGPLASQFPPSPPSASGFYPRNQRVVS